MDIDLLLMVEKGIKGGICHAFNSSLYKSKQIHKGYWDVNNLYGQAMSQKLPGTSSKCFNTFNEDLIKISQL